MADIQTPKRRLANLTVREALEETVKMWTWLAEDPGAHNKWDWPGTDAWDGTPSGSCFLCEISQRRNPDPAKVSPCNVCPLYNRWGVRSSTRSVKSCMDDGRGLYDHWLNNSSRKGKPFYARLIAKRAAEVLAELDAEK